MLTYLFCLNLITTTYKEIFSALYVEILLQMLGDMEFGAALDDAVAADAAIADRDELRALRDKLAR